MSRLVKDGARTRRARRGGLLTVSAVLVATSAASPRPVDPVDPSYPARARGEQGSAPGVPGEDAPTQLSARDRTTTAAFTGPVPVAFGGGIPSTVLDAYRRAHLRTSQAQPRCRLPLALLAAIGKVESGHARSGRVDPAGTTVEPILGPVLNGGVFAAIPDTDGGLLDADPVWDRAVGPMQFIPGTWDRWASDGNDDNRASPHNIYDASLASARYVCTANRDLGTPAGLDAAILSYNNSTSYLSLVRSWLAAYSGGLVPVPDSTAPVPATDPVQAAPAPATQPSSPAPPSPEPSPEPSPQPPPPTRAPLPPGDPVVGVLCATQAIVDTGLGVVGGLLGLDPAARPACAQETSQPGQ